MIKTLRITGIIAAIGAAILLIIPAVYGVRSDPKIEEFLKTPGAVEKFTAAKGQHPTKKDTESPLVKQAVDYGKHLNPPPPQPPKVEPGAAAQAAIPTPPVPVAAKFDLIATSYFASQPDRSFVLIDEAGKGLHWVKQGATVGRVTIDKIKDGAIIVRDGQRTSEMTVKVQENWRGLLKNPPPPTRPGTISVNPALPAATAATVQNPAQPSPVTADKPGISTPARPGSPPLPGRRTTRGGLTVPAAERITAASQQPPAAQPLPTETTTTQQETTPPQKSLSANEIQAKIDKLIAEMESEKDETVTAAKMAEVGKLLEQKEKLISAEQTPETQTKSENQPDAAADINK
jgi:hypothetical protein